MTGGGGNGVFLFTAVVGRNILSILKDSSSYLYESAEVKFTWF